MSPIGFCIIIFGLITSTDSINRLYKDEQVRDLLISILVLDKQLSTPATTLSPKTTILSETTSSSTTTTTSSLAKTSSLTTATASSTTTTSSLAKTTASAATTAPVKRRWYAEKHDAEKRLYEFLLDLLDSDSPYERSYSNPDKRGRQKGYSESDFDYLFE
ncbi:unnamed protein product [Didymodactylos carnosus]|uniref:Uncharacterized protein n=1 Tax=Didymodactylos carnosus TaxID=1234261 RepID=A0A814V9K1_9BILA|nr:unnamed protein product [Didymodactylos carnosus]CAF3946826.1 unnamed protein product [Didymodactylos carnosus]